MSPTEPGPVRLQVLSPEQHALLGLVCEEWLGVGLATGPADWAAAEQGVRLAYQATGLSPPRRMVWLGSPLAGTIAAAMLWVADLSDHAPDGSWRALRDQLRASLWVQPSLGPPASEGVAAEWFGTPAGRQVQQRVAERVRLAVMDQVSARLGSPAWETLSRVVESAVAEQLRELALPLHELIRRVVDPVVTPLLANGDEVAAWEFDWELPDPLQGLWGQHDVDWLAKAAALRQLVPGTLDAPGLDGLMQVARSAGWWWPFEHLVVLTERPVTLHHDPQGRLHDSNGPAIAYPDGFAVWAWHGVGVPRQVIEQPERLTLGQIHHEPNAAVRQVMVERYGPDRYLRDAGAERISHDHTGTLWRLEVGGERLVMVEVRNSTPEPDGTHRPYWLRVPPWVHTAREAVAWTFGLGADSYQPIIET
jgi:hypothetical protein